MWILMNKTDLKLYGSCMCCVKRVKQIVCVGAGICRKRGKHLSVHWIEGIQRQTEVLHGCQQQNKHCLFTSMWEELGVYLLEGFLIYNATWTLLERGSETKREGETHKFERQTSGQVGKTVARD